MYATAKELRFHSKKLLDVISRGEEVVITYRGKPCAKLVPIENAQNTIRNKKNDNCLFGIWKDNDAIASVDKYVRNLRKGRF